MYSSFLLIWLTSSVKWQLSCINSITFLIILLDLFCNRKSNRFHLTSKFQGTKWPDPVFNIDLRLNLRFCWFFKCYKCKGTDMFRLKVQNRKVLFIPCHHNIRIRDTCKLPNGIAENSQTPANLRVELRRIPRPQVNENTKYRN